MSLFIPSNNLPQPTLSTAIFCFTSVYSIFTQITIVNILSCPIIFLKILFLSPDYQRNVPTLLSIFKLHPNFLGNILSYPIFFLQILFLFTVYSLEYSSSAQIIHSNIWTQLSIFYIHPDYTIEYSVLPPIITANIIPQPRLSTAIFCLSTVYSMITQIKLGNILSFPILFMQILFLSPDNRR